LKLSTFSICSRLYILYIFQVGALLIIDCTGNEDACSVPLPKKMLNKASLLFGSQDDSELEADHDDEQEEEDEVEERLVVEDDAGYQDEGGEEVPDGFWEDGDADGDASAIVDDAGEVASKVRITVN